MLPYQNEPKVGRSRGRTQVESDRSESDGREPASVETSSPADSESDVSTW